jgi:Tol biopolymer transport system component
MRTIRQDVVAGLVVLAFAGAVHAAPAPQLTFTQLTETTGCTAGGFVGNLYPSLSGVGGKMAFTSSCDLIPGGNPDQNGELFVRNVGGGGLTQLTFSTGGVGSMHTSIDWFGARVVFASDRDLVPGQNTDGNFEIFVINSNGTGLTQLTHTTGGGDFPGCTYPGWDRAGDKIVFTSDRDLIPGGNADGNHEVFVMNPDGSGVLQVTATTGGWGNGDASLNGNGSRVLFSSDRDLVPGGNLDANSDLFVMDVYGGSVQQITHTTGGIGQVAPRWTANGKVLTFRSDLDLVGENPDAGFEVFRMNTNGTGLVQVTTSASGLGFSAPWDIAGDGKTMILHSDRDLVPGGNADHNMEIYLAQLHN